MFQGAFTNCKNSWSYGSTNSRKARQAIVGASAHSVVAKKIPSAPSRTACWLNRIKVRLIASKDRWTQFGPVTNASLTRSSPSNKSASTEIALKQVEITGKPGKRSRTSCKTESCCKKELGSSGASVKSCLLYTSDAADDLLCVDLGGRRI